jgi:hypothetical protein
MLDAPALGHGSTSSLAGSPGRSWAPDDLKELRYVSEVRVGERYGLAPLDVSAHAGVGSEGSGEGTRRELRGVRRLLLSTRT